MAWNRCVVRGMVSGLHLGARRRRARPGLAAARQGPRGDEQADGRHHGRRRRGDHRIDRQHQPRPACEKRGDRRGLRLAWDGPLPLPVAQEWTKSRMIEEAVVQGRRGFREQPGGKQQEGGGRQQRQNDANRRRAKTDAASDPIKAAACKIDGCLVPHCHARSRKDQDQDSVRMARRGGAAYPPRATPVPGIWAQAQESSLPWIKFRKTAAGPAGTAGRAAAASLPPRRGGYDRGRHPDRGIASPAISVPTPPRPGSRPCRSPGSPRLPRRGSRPARAPPARARGRRAGSGRARRA